MYRVGEDKDKEHIWVHHTVQLVEAVDNEAAQIHHEVVEEKILATASEDP